MSISAVFQNPIMVLALAMTMLSIFLMGVVALFMIKIPNIMVLTFGSSFVFEIGNSGRIVPKKAVQQGDCFRTKDGLYHFSKEDVCYWKGKPTLLVMTPYSRAIRPNVMKAFKVLKDHDIFRVRELDSLIAAQELTVDEWNQYVAQRNAPQEEEQDE